MSAQRWRPGVFLLAWAVVSAAACAESSGGSGDALHIDNAAEAARLAGAMASLHDIATTPERRDDTAAPDAYGVMVDSGTRVGLRSAWLVAPGALGLLAFACVLMLVLRRAHAPQPVPSAWRVLLVTAAVGLLAAAGCVLGMRWYGGRFPPAATVMSVDVLGGEAGPTGRVQWARAVASGAGRVDLGADWDADPLWFRRQGETADAFTQTARTELERTRMPALIHLEVVGVPRGVSPQPAVSLAGAVHVPYTGSRAEASLAPGAAEAFEWVCVLRRIATLLTGVRLADTDRTAMRPPPDGAGRACVHATRVLLPHADAVATGEMSDGGPAHRRFVLQSLPVQVDFPRERELVFAVQAAEAMFPSPENIDWTDTPLSNSTVTGRLDCEPGFPIRADERIEQAVLMLGVEWLPGEGLDRKATVTVACRTDGSEWRPLVSVFFKPVAEMTRQELLKELKAVRATAEEGILYTYEKPVVQPESVVKPGIDSIECRISHTGDGPAIRLHWLRLSLKLKLEE